ncbi:LysR family transcriptional regulator [Secundilactobacillus similis]|uniref:LysR family transcriptional regulator n=1 Tax=Secundilactobacillus similis TaxID=414682 RepID=UPI0006D29C54|nr:LysR family transcriptional regulator [Secundilactobacillus similis]
MAINMHWINIFITVASTKSFTETATEMYISQPSISKAIHNLESELQVKLFVRDRKQGLSLTDSGQRILKIAKELSKNEATLFQVAFDANHQLSGRLRVGSIPIISTTILAKVFGYFKANYPLVNIELSEGNSREIKQLLRANSIDVGITTSPNQCQNKQSLFSDHMVALSANNSDAIDLTNSDETFIFCKAGSETVIDLLDQNQNFNFKNWLIVDRGETVIAMVEQNVGVGIISNYVLTNTPHSDKLYVNEISPKLELSYDLITNNDAQKSPIISKFIETVKFNALKS